MKKAVCALITDISGYILGVSRKDNHLDFGLPGGKVDGDETWEEALIREVKEETGLDVEVLEEIFQREDDEFQVKTFHCKIVSGKISSAETGKVNWITWEELTSERCSFAKYNFNLRQRLYNNLMARFNK